MNPIGPLILTASDVRWPHTVERRLNVAAPSRLWAVGDTEILSLRKVGLFCSERCPDEAALAARKALQRLDADSRVVVSGFQSPVEKDCLRILLEAGRPAIVCPARSLQKVRLPDDWLRALEAGRLLLLSRFEKTRRADKETARRRNELVAALSDEILIIHAEPGGQVERISALAERWRVPRLELGSAR
ncbi:MAG TPA: DNA-processing protein DprA [candidate division Zixibacteria bacterium]|nr:DNA-processing protein DprA [candidate division Zixibacteria bacterium]